MLQRIQSIFLLLAAVCFGMEYVWPFAKSDRTVSGIFEDGQYNIQDHLSLEILTLAGVLLCIIIIFLYKNRGLQLRLGYLAMTISIVLAVIAVMIYSNHTSSLDEVQITDQAGLYLPVLVIIFISLGIRFIKKDEKLVQSMNRLR